VITSPVLIIGCPRSGTTLLYRILAEAEPLWSIGGESRHLIERDHHPAAAGWESGALTADDVTPATRRRLPAAFERESAPWTFWARVGRLRAWLDRSSGWRAVKRARESAAPSARLAARLPRSGLAVIQVLVRASNAIVPRAGRPKRLLEKTPENCLRLPFLLELFPDARVLHLTRDGRANVGSLIDGWLRPDLFRGYRVPERLSVAGVPAERWAFTLIPGWRELRAASLEEICARQWIACNQAALDLAERRPGLVLRLRYEDLVARPDEVLAAIAEFAELRLPPRLPALPHANVLSAPDPGKWARRHGDAIRRIEPLIASVMERLGYRPGDSRS
jgi:hypothetical protein